VFRAEGIADTTSPTTATTGSDGYRGELASRSASGLNAPTSGRDLFVLHERREA